MNYLVKCRNTGEVIAVLNEEQAKYYILALLEKGSRSTYID